MKLRHTGAGSGSPSIMKTWNSVAFTGGVLAMAVTAGVLVVTREQEPRPAQSLVQATMTTEPAPGSRLEAAGLFVGVRTFPHTENPEVPYAVDDAVDLAYQFSLNPRSSLVPPLRVVLALSGSPQKEESQQRLRELRDAGARVERATSGDILNLLKQQVRKAGDGGLFVLSIATHGFLDDKGDSYILGSSSSIGEVETSLQLSRVIDIAGRAERSLMFVDACRNRDGQTSRGVAAGAATAAPMLAKMKRIRGQAIFYAAAPGGYAVDDRVQKNGVFTRAVLDGLRCEASAPHHDVVVETLHKYVEREVRQWFKENKNMNVDPATQISMEGETRNMPLARCRPTPAMKLRVAGDGSAITAYDKDTTRPLWHEDVGNAIVHAEAADLDADAFEEAVAATRDRIIVFDHEGHELWRRGDGTPLVTFTTGDLFEKHTHQVVAVWAGERSPTSRITVFDSAGKELSSYDAPERLQYVAVDRPTNMHAPKIVVAGSSSVFVLNPKKLTNRKPLWQQTLASSGDSIREVRIADVDHDSLRDIEVSTKAGTTLFAFDGRIVKRGAEWQEIGKRKRRSDSAP